MQLQKRLNRIPDRSKKARKLVRIKYVVLFEHIN